MRDERLIARRLLGELEVSSVRPLVLFAAALSVAAATAWLPDWSGLAPAGRVALFITVFAAGLWLTEAIPAFAVGVVIIGLELLLLADIAPRETFMAPWGSPVIWLFFGGFVLGAAAVKSGIDRWLSGYILALTGQRPTRVLLGAMASTFVFSMFMSNTATATMMLTVLMPAVVTLAIDDPYRKALPLGIAFAANIGGMGTIIGSPPNAIAVGLLEPVAPISFLAWSSVALPPALLLTALAWLFLVRRYPSRARIDLASVRVETRPALPLWQRLVIIVVFVLTVLLWITGPLHGLPTAAVSFLPITVLTVTRVIGSDDIRALPWDVLLMVAGGLALGVAIEITGLAVWLVEGLPIDDLGPIALVFAFAWCCSVVSNFMSNTAAANILLPLAMAMSGNDPAYVVPVALAASTAMCLPISTPPNALAASGGHLTAKDFIPGGLIILLLGTPLVVAGCWLVLGGE